MAKIRSSHRPQKRRLSCENCRRRRARCSRTINCDGCVSRGQPCVWRDGVPPPGPILSAADENALERARSEVAHLHTVVESLLQKIRVLESEKTPAQPVASSRAPTGTNSFTARVENGYYTYYDTFDHSETIPYNGGIVVEEAGMTFPLSYPSFVFPTIEDPMSPAYSCGSTSSSLSTATASPMYFNDLYTTPPSSLESCGDASPWQFDAPNDMLNMYEQGCMGSVELALYNPLA